ncbi:hypothetical protein SxD43FB_22055 [Sphingobium sp. D43FB]|nr:hypothetical protein SxD43FB_22055 [Sphingobium sp. D43FB]
MGKSAPTRFSVTPENEAAALARVSECGYSPIRIEKSEDGLIVLFFAPRPSEEMAGLMDALPLHLSAKIDVVAGNDVPFQLPDKTKHRP